MLLFLSENIILFNNQTITCLLIQIKILYTCIQNILYRISKFYVFLCITLYYICIKSQKVKRKNSIFDRSGSQCLVIHMQICKYILQFYKLRVDLVCQIETQKEKISYLLNRVSDYFVIYSSTQTDWSTSSYYDKLHSIISSLVYALQLIEVRMSLLNPSHDLPLGSFSTPRETTSIPNLFYSFFFFRWPPICTDFLLRKASF